MAYGRITQKQSEILEYIKSQILNKGYPPSVRDICAAVNLKSTSSVHAHLESLEKNGYIRRDPTKSRTIEIIDDNFNLARREVVNVPILGRVAAGEPLLAVDNITGYFPIPAEFMPNEECFMLTVQGESMINTGIYNGDHVIVKKCNTAENSDIVVCDIRLAYDDSLKDSEWSCTVESRNDVFSKIIDMSMMPASWNKIIRRELYDGMQFPVGINNEDVAVTPIVLARAKKISVINKPYYNYYQREGSIQNSEFSEKRFVILNTVKMCIDQFNKIDPVKAEKIKGSLYMHQVLSMALYPIRKQKFKLRYHLLKKYMEKVRMDFPDLWENQEIKESLQWEGRRMRYFRKISYGLLKNRLYLMTSLFWTVCNYSLKIYNNRNKR